MVTVIDLYDIYIKFIYRMSGSFIVCETECNKWIILKQK